MASGRSLALAGHQPSSGFSEKSCLEGIKVESEEAGHVMSFLALDCAHIYRHAHPCAHTRTHTLELVVMAAQLCECTDTLNCILDKDSSVAEDKSAFFPFVPKQHSQDCCGRMTQQKSIFYNLLLKGSQGIL